MNHFLVIFCCRIDVMSTASHIVGTRPYTALVAEVRWRQCGCCWRVELTVASRTTTMTPQWWWPRTKKWVRRWQRGKKNKYNGHCCNSIDTVLFLLFCFMVVCSCFLCWKTINLLKVTDLTVNHFLIFVQIFSLSLWFYYGNSQLCVT